MKATVEINLEDIFDSDGEQSIGEYVREALIEALNKAVKDAVKNCPELRSIVEQTKQKVISEIVTAYTEKVKR